MLVWSFIVFWLLFLSPWIQPAALAALRSQWQAQVQAIPRTVASARGAIGLVQQMQRPVLEATCQYSHGGAAGSHGAFPHSSRVVYGKWKNPMDAWENPNFTHPNVASARSGWANPTSEPSVAKLETPTAQLTQWPTGFPRSSTTPSPNKLPQGTLQFAGTWFRRMYNNSSASARNFIQCATEYLRSWAVKYS